MPILFSGPGGRVLVSTPNFQGKIKGMRPALRQGAINAIKDIAEQHRDLISNGIRSGALGVAPLLPSTIRTRLSGKTDGLTPARPIKRGSIPLSYTGVSARAIQVRMRSSLVYEVGQPSNAFIGYSRTRMQDAATMQEKGFTRRGKYTRAQLAFLHIMFRKGGQSARKAKLRGGARVGTAYTQTVGARPAWENASRKIQPKIPRTVQRHIRESVRAAGLKLDT